eukprot:gene20950-23000_t
MLPEFKANDTTNIFDVLWKSAWALKPERPMWNGFMQMVHNGEHPGQSSIIFMPMIDMKSSDESCIMSTMHFVAEQAERYNMSPILTFDKPLYWKGIEIQLSEDDSSVLKKIVLRLGGLHTTMSFLGSIGHIMTSSGLQAILETVYTENTVPYMLNGKAISRAVRGHLLVVATLHAIIMSEVYSCPINLVNDEERNQGEDVLDIGDSVDLQQISELFDKSISGEISSEDLEQSEVIKTMVERLEAYRKNLASSRTATLWFKYIEMVEIPCKFIKAERTGNYHLHWQAVKDMLPYFAASGHSLYAKLAYVYLQTMSKLEETHPNVCQMFANGYQGEYLSNQRSVKIKA